MLNELGVYAEVVSQDEYEMVGLCGLLPINFKNEMELETFAQLWGTKKGYQL